MLEGCPRCGGEFACGADAGSCWCAEVALGDAARARLAAAFERCLCPACLAEAAAEAAGALDVRTQRPDPAGELGV